MTIVERLNTEVAKSKRWDWQPTTGGKYTPEEWQMQVFGSAVVERWYVDNDPAPVAALIAVRRSAPIP